MLQVARRGEQDFLEATTGRKISGLYSAVTSGRSITFVLQNLSSACEGWNEWYASEVEHMKRDEVCRWFVTVRNRIEKQGTPGSGSIAVFEPLGGMNRFIAELQSLAPEGTVGMFLFDRLGRCGWVVRLGDGTEREVYYGAPDGVSLASMYLDDAPGGYSLEYLLPQYLDKLEALIDRAAQRFG